ncbi:hypothetical protein V1502_08130 [Bacillus sp. SCS-153A]|uniref:hypothetical protein n=1 Tax=Rossellomorea sedimentorum TaxID=3115294 RepID=UPI003905E574
MRFENENGTARDELVESIDLYDTKIEEELVMNQVENTKRMEEMFLKKVNEAANELLTAQLNMVNIKAENCDENTEMELNRNEEKMRRLSFLTSETQEKIFHLENIWYSYTFKKILSPLYAFDVFTEDKLFDTLFTATVKIYTDLYGETFWLENDDFGNALWVAASEVIDRYNPNDRLYLYEQLLLSFEITSLKVVKKVSNNF